MDDKKNNQETQQRKDHDHSPREIEHEEPTDVDVASSMDADSAAVYRMRMHTDLKGLVEDLIEDGRQRGIFDNLKGKGKPLPLQRNIYEGSQELANRLLKDNQLRPAWISHRLTILERIEELRGEIGRTWQRYEEAVRLARGEGQTGALVVGWDDLCRKWEAEIVKINKLINDYNLKRPSERLEIFKLRLTDELQRAGAPRYLRSTL